MNLRVIPQHEAAPLIAAIQAMSEVRARAAWRAENPLPRRGRPVAIEEGFPCAGDFGLSGRETGQWGRLRANGLSPQDAADVVKAARIAPPNGAA